MTGRVALALAALAAAGPAGGQETRIGSKADNESGLLAEMATQLVRAAGGRAAHRRQLGGTLVLWEGLKAGQVDAYPEFTGTLAFQILKDPALTDLPKLRAALAGLGIGVTDPLGYENSYALGVTAETAARLGVAKVSDLAAHPGLRLAFSPEFARRPDCWPGLRRHYALPHGEPRPLEHTVAVRAVAEGQADVADVYTTEADVAALGLRVLADDRRFFPPYQAVFVYRLDWADRNPAGRAALDRLEGRLDEASVRDANLRVKTGTGEGQAAADLLRARVGAEAVADVESPAGRLLTYTGQHLVLVALSLSAAVIVAIPLGVAAAKLPRLGRLLVGATGVVQTVPSLALLVFLVTVPVVGGLGERPAVVALFLYSLLPIVRNTATGLTDIPPQVREAADGIGLTPWQKLRLVELPLASRAILAGVRTAAVINIGTATLGALVGAGGLGEPIQDGLRNSDNARILLGAVPAAGLALAAEGLFGLLERAVVPRGLRLPAGR